MFQNVPFYERTGFKVKEVQMVLYKVYLTVTVDECLLMRLAG